MVSLLLLCLQLDASIFKSFLLALSCLLASAHTPVLPPRGHRAGPGLTRPLQGCLGGPGCWGPRLGAWVALHLLAVPARLGHAAPRTPAVPLPFTGQLPSARGELLPGQGGPCGTWLVGVTLLFHLSVLPEGSGVGRRCAGRQAVWPL